MRLVQVPRTRSAVIEHEFVDAGEDTIDAGAVTYTVARLDGTVLQTGNATNTATGVYEFVLEPVAALDLLRVTWAGTIDTYPVAESGLVEIVSGFYFGLRAARNSDDVLKDTTKYPTSYLITKRREAETEVEQICGRAFIPRFARVQLDGSGTSRLILPDSDIRTVRAVLVAPTPGSTPVPIDAAELPTVAALADGTLVRTSGRRWTAGPATTIIEYEHGTDAPDEELHGSMLLRLRSLVTRRNSGIPDRATSFTAANGGTYRVSLPGASTTGIPDVDAVYQRKSRGGFGRNAPAARLLEFDPQRHSLFHGGRS